MKKYYTREVIIILLHYLLDYKCNHLDILPNMNHVSSRSEWTCYCLLRIFDDSLTRMACESLVTDRIYGYGNREITESTQYRNTNQYFWDTGEISSDTKYIRKTLYHTKIRIYEDYSFLLSRERRECTPAEVCEKLL